MENNLVTIDNMLVEASYSLTLVEKRLILCIISTVDNNIKKSKEGDFIDRRKTISSETEFSISVMTYAEIYNIDYETAKDEVEAAVLKLSEQKVTYRIEGKETTTSWTDSIVKYNRVKHEVTFKFSNGILPLISNLSKNFTSYKLKYLRMLPSFYSIRWYELAVMELNRRRKSIIHVTVPVSQIRSMFQLQDKYPLFANLVKRVVIEPLNSINNTKGCNIHIWIKTVEVKKKDKSGNLVKKEVPQYIKEGKKVIAVQLTIQWKGKPMETHEQQIERIAAERKAKDLYDPMEAHRQAN